MQRSLVALLLMAVILTVLPFLVSPYDLSLTGRFLAVGLVALGLVWAWGYAGILSLGQGIFFGLGGYAIAMHLKLSALSPGELPDFMVWNGIEALPWWWAPFRNPVFAILMAVLLPAALAFTLGILLFRRRVTGVYFSLITQALALAFSTLLISQQGLTGGFNGLTNFASFLGQSFADPIFQRGLYWATALLVLLVIGGSLALRSTHFGLVLRALREGENRTRFLGYDVALYKAAAFSLAGFLAGLGGALFTLHAGVVSPAFVGVQPSIEFVIWTVLGGKESFFGAVLASLLGGFVRDRVSSLFPDLWLYLVGGLFVLVVLLPALRSTYRKGVKGVEGHGRLPQGRRA